MNIVRQWWAGAVANLRTTIPGAVAFLLGISGVTEALYAWAGGQPVNWRQVVVSIAIAVGGIGHMNSKDALTHSTEKQVEQATVEAKAEDKK